MEYGQSMRDRQNHIAHGDGTVLEDRQQDGQRFYRQKRYEDALQCFNQAIVQDAKAPIGIYDNRAATHTKLGNLRAALRDGKEMIQQEKTNCMGYLRTGKVLQLLDKRDAALDIYQLGIRKVPAGSENIKLLECMRDKLARQLFPQNSVDPLKILPFELMEIIIRHLKFAERINLLRVSKSWRELLVSMPAIWIDLDFQAAKKAVPFGTTREYIKRSNGNTVRLSTDRFGQSQEKTLCYVADRCKKLQELNISFGFVGSSLLKAAPSLRNLQKLILSSQCEITQYAANRLLTLCQNLKYADFGQIAFHQPSEDQWIGPLLKLEFLRMDTGVEKPHGPRSLGVSSLIPRFPEVRNLSLRNWLLSYSGTEADFTLLTRLETLDITGCFIPEWPRLPPSVCDLRMKSSCCYPPNYHTLISAKQPLPLPNLRHLSASAYGAFSFSDDLYPWLLPNKGKLLQLDIGGRSDFDSEDLLKLIEEDFLQSVENLDFKACQVTDQVAMSLALKAPRLRSLDLSQTAITGVGVKELVTRLKGTLTTLVLNHCERISPDAVELARSMGVMTSYGFSEKPGKGKKIRLG